MRDKVLKIVNFLGEEKEVYLRLAQYQNTGGLYIGLLENTSDGFEPYADLTVNLGYAYGDELAFVDVNNLTNACQFIESNKLGESMGFSEQSGFVSYPLYVFDRQRLEELAVEIY